MAEKLNVNQPLIKRKKRKNKLSITQKYERRRIWAGYFGISLKPLKRASQKALKEANKVIRKKRMELKQEGVTDIPSVSQVAKYEREAKELEHEARKEEKEPLPYAELTETPYYNETEDIINDFMSTMQQALHEAITAYGLSQPWIAKNFEQQILDIMSKFNEIRATMGNEYTADRISKSLDYEQIITTIAYDYDEATNMLDNMADVFDGILNGM